MYNIFYENLEQMENIESRLAKFRAKIVIRNIDYLGLNNSQIEAILKNNAVFRDVREH